MSKVRSFPARAEFPSKVTVISSTLIIVKTVLDPSGLLPAIASPLWDLSPPVTGFRNNLHQTFVARAVGVCGKNRDCF